MIVSDEPDPGRPMRVLIVVASSDRRGAELEGVALAGELCAAGVDASAVALWAGGQGGIPNVEVLGKSALSLPTLLALRRQSINCDLVVAYGSTTLPACAMALLGSRTPFVYRSIGDPRYWAGGAIRRLRTRLLLRRAKAVVALWPGAAKSIRRLYGIGSSNLRVIPNARDSSWFRPATASERAAARAVLGIERGAVVVAVVGALEPEKDVGRAVRSALEVEGCRVLVAGDGSQRQALEKAFNDDRVTWLGSVPEIRSVIWSADVLVNTSRSEGLAGVIIEAALCGLKIVATAVGAAGDNAFGDSVTLVDLANSDSELRDAIEMALGAPRVLGQAREFTWEAVVPLWLDFFREIGAAESLAAPASRALRVLYLIDSLAPGGAETSLAEMAPAVIERGVDLRVAYLLERNGVKDRLEDSGVPVYSLAAADGRWQKLLAFSRLVRSTEPDLVHTTLFEADIIGRLGARSAGTPVVSSLVNTTYDQAHFADPNVRRGRLIAARWLDRVSSRLVCRFHALSEGVRSEMTSQLDVVDQQIVVVPRGRDLSKYSAPSPEARSKARTALGIDVSAPMVLAVGRQDEQKALDVALRAMDLLLARMPTARLVVAGKPGTASSVLQELISALELSESVTFLGHRSDVIELMTAADVLLFPSRREGFGGVLIEAMASSVPIVCSDLEVLREVTTDGNDHAALHVQVGSATGFANALATVLTDPDLAVRLGSVGRRIVENRYEINRVADLMCTFWENAAKECQQWRGRGFGRPQPRSWGAGRRDF